MSLAFRALRAASKRSTVGGRMTSVITSSTTNSTSIAVSTPSAILIPKRQLSSTPSSSVVNPADAHLSGANAAYVESIYQQWKNDPSSVHPSWNAYFSTGIFVSPPGLAGNANLIASTPIETSTPSSGSGSGSVDGTLIKVIDLVRNFQSLGHLIADIDPLGREPTRLGGAKTHPQLTPEYYGFTEADLNRTFNIGVASSPDTQGFLSRSTQPMTLRQLIQRLNEVYAGTTGYEFSHLDNPEEINWLRSKIERIQGPRDVPADEQLRILRRLIQANRFETFIGVKFNTKRFGIEGGESSIVALREIMRKSTDLGVDTCIMGMAHRGRLNVLANIVKKPLEIIFAEFGGYSDAGPPLKREKGGAFPLEREESIGAGDVKYHQGWSSTHTIDNGKDIHITMLPNPSHLEAVNPLVQGKTKAKQFFSNDTNGDKTMSVLIHGDASFAGQGVVYESMALHGLPDYNVGGTIHLIINNQIGFTTDPFNSRSGPYCSDLAKAFRAPIFHVNGDDAEAVAEAAAIAAEFRAKFRRDVVIDVVCYRYNGHNEMDNPYFTQPMMYKKVKSMFHDGIASAVQKYTQKVIQGGKVTQAQIDQVVEETNSKLKSAFEKARDILEGKSVEAKSPNAGQYCTAQWNGLQDMTVRNAQVEPTAVPGQVLMDLGLQFATIPEDIRLQKAIGDAYKAKKTSIEAGKNIDWATGEAFAFATLLAEGYPVRIAGQDAQRGTFSHRHAVVHCQETGKKYTPLHHLHLNPSLASPKDFKFAPTPAHFTAVNSPLSEFAAMGFELGYSMDHPNQLVLWEAQFGDFVNGAQIILDNFLASGEHKWNKQSALVLLLPHGFEGQGAEHSSARMERFLQAANDDPYDITPGDVQTTFRLQRCTWQVVNITTPANYYHALRRQVKRSFRKPLIVFSPKSLLRHRSAVSTLEDFTGQTKFQVVIGDPYFSDATMSRTSKVRRHIMCSGKVYYEIIEQIEKAGLRDVVAVTRLEQVSPFPFQEVRNEDARYPNAELVWVQEEHMNMGPWTYVQPRIETAVKEKRGDSFRVRYIGRAPSAAAATGSGKVHTEEQQCLVHEIVDVTK